MLSILYRFVVVVLALGGATLWGYRGFIWDYVARMQGLEALRRTNAFLFAGAALGLVAAVLVVGGRGKLATLLLLLAAAGPFVLVPSENPGGPDFRTGLGIFVSPLVLAALLAFFVRNRPAPLAADE